MQTIRHYEEHFLVGSVIKYEVDKNRGVISECTSVSTFFDSYLDLLYHGANPIFASYSIHSDGTYKGDCKIKSKRVVSKDYVQHFTHTFTLNEKCLIDGVLILKMNTKDDEGRRDFDVDTFYHKSIHRDGILITIINE